MTAVRMADEYWTKTSSLVDEVEVETFTKTPSLYGWCILTPFYSHNNQG